MYGNPLAAFGWTGSGKAKASCFTHIKGRGALADARANVKSVHRQVADFERSCIWHGVDETDHTRRCVDGLFAALRRHEAALTEYTEENVEANDALERASGNLVAAASTLYAIDPVLFRAKMGVELMSAVRGLDSKEAFERYLADLEMIAEDRRERAAQREKVKTEGYTDRRGKDHSPADIAAKAERGRQCNAMPGGRDVALESRTSAGGRGLQDTAANDEQMRREQDRKARAQQRKPHGQRDAVDAAHKARNALPPPLGADRSVGGYVVMGYLVPPGAPNPPTWNRAEIERRVAEFRERTGVPVRPQNETARHVNGQDGSWRVQPSESLLRPLKLRGLPTSIFNPETRSCNFPVRDEAVVAYEKFMSPSTSNDERKAMFKVPRDALICAHCGQGFFSKKQSLGVRLRNRQNHERLCPERSSSSSEEEESDEDESEEESDEEESEEEESEEVVAPPSPKRVRSSWFSGLW
jgi:hypothetical protein